LSFSFYPYAVSGSCSFRPILVIFPQCVFSFVSLLPPHCGCANRSVLLQCRRLPGLILTVLYFSRPSNFDDCGLSSPPLHSLPSKLCGTFPSFPVSVKIKGFHSIFTPLQKFVLLRPVFFPPSPLLCSEIGSDALFFRARAHPHLFPPAVSNFFPVLLHFPPPKFPGPMFFRPLPDYLFSEALSPFPPYIEYALIPRLTPKTSTSFLFRQIASFLLSFQPRVFPCPREHFFPFFLCSHTIFPFSSSLTAIPFSSGLKKVPSHTPLGGYPNRKLLFIF